MPVGAEPDAAPRTEEALDELLSRPTDGVVEALRAVDGDLIVLGAGGKMGPSLARMLRRAVEQVGAARRVIAVSRFSDPAAAAALARWGVETIAGDLTSRADVDRFPDVPNVIFMAGQKFGTSEAPAATWIANTVVPAMAAERYRGARIVAFSTGNVYPLTPVSGRGSAESDPVAPIGEYAASCVGRERVFAWYAGQDGTRVAIVRLNYAVDLRYGVLVDIAQRVRDGLPVDLGMSAVNVIWQRDANAQAIGALRHAAAPPFILNVAGPERLSIRDIAERLGRRFGRQPRFTGAEGREALLSDSTRAQQLFGPPTLPAERLIEWVADWLTAGGRTLGKPTHFETRDGRF